MFNTWQSTPGLSLQLLWVLEGLGDIDEVTEVELEVVVEVGTVEDAVVGLHSRQ